MQASDSEIIRRGTFYIVVDASLVRPGLLQGRRQVKICGVDRHGERKARAYNGGLEAERPSPTPPPVKRVGFYQFQERPPAKMGWTCPLQSTPWRRHWSPIALYTVYLGRVLMRRVKCRLLLPL